MVDVDSRYTHLDAHKHLGIARYGEDSQHKILATIRGALGVAFNAKLLYSRKPSV